MLPDLRAGEIDFFWRAGFDVAIDLLEDRRVAFAIETGEGILLDLPHPDEHALTPMLHAAPGFTTRKARRHLALVAGILAAASVPMGIPAIAITQSGDKPDPASTQQQQTAADGQTTTGDQQPVPTDTGTAAQQAEAATPAADPNATPAATDPGATGPAATDPTAATDPATGPTPVDPATGTPVIGDPTGTEPHAHRRKHQHHSGSKHPAKPKHKHKKHRTHKHRTPAHGPSHNTGSGSSGGGAATPAPAPGGTTSSAATPSFFDALPGPSDVRGVPNFVIQKFRVPIFLLPIYQSAGIQYGIRWEVLAAINEIETDYGRNLNVSSAGAVGWMQFMPATWKMYGVDGNRDGKKDPFNPVDAIFASARYLKAAGGDKDIRRAVFAYNHAGWYVDSVMLRAKLITGIPGDLVGSLTGLTEGRFPVAGNARYADDTAARSAKKVKPGQNAANVIESNAARRGIDIYSKRGAPVVAVSDGVVKKVGHDRSGARVVVLQDAYGNSYTYRGLGSTAKWYPVPKT
ncbi:MAG: hypothetical protein QOH89_689, partial [Pseudonocardiales bacterium]|nr:hypothetical protein [Pseudonocardiales bacterium]